MKNLVIILVMIIAVSCTTSRNVQKSSAIIDSTTVKKEAAAVTSNEVVSIETKNISIVSDTVRTKADSAKANFSFNPADSSDDVEVTIETGALTAKATFNKKTGKGTLEAKKKQEEIPVNKYLEENTKLNHSKSDSSGSNSFDSTHFSNTATGKLTYRENDYTWLWIIGSLVLLALLVRGYFWLRNQYTKPKRDLP